MKCPRKLDKKIGGISCLQMVSAVFFAAKMSFPSSLSRYLVKAYSVQSLLAMTTPTRMAMLPSHPIMVMRSLSTIQLATMVATGLR